MGLFSLFSLFQRSPVSARSNGPATAGIPGKMLGGSSIGSKFWHSHWQLAPRIRRKREAAVTLGWVAEGAWPWSPRSEAPAATRTASSRVWSPLLAPRSPLSTVVFGVFRSSLEDVLSAAFQGVEAGQGRGDRNIDVRHTQVGCLPRKPPELSQDPLALPRVPQIKAQGTGTDQLQVPFGRTPSRQFGFRPSPATSVTSIVGRGSFWKESLSPKSKSAALTPPPCPPP